MAVSSTVGQRFLQLIQQLGMSKNAFALSLDKTATVIQHLVDERNKPGFDLMNKVVEVYPNVSLYWLMKGEGPMLLTADTAPVPGTPPAEAAAKPSGVPLIPPGFPAAQPAATAPEAMQPVPEASAPALLGLPAAAAPASAPEAARQPVAAAPATQRVPTAQLPAPSAVSAAPPVAAPPDATYLTAALHAQHLQHQLALAEQRNQHLLEQQALMQQMLDLLRRPA